MGYNMACRLSEAGFKLIVYNRTRSKATKFVDECGGEAVDSPMDVGESSDVVHIMVADNDAVSSVLLKPRGLLSSGRKFKIVVQSTITPQFSSFMKSLVEASGRSYVEAPVLGSVSESREGKLLTYVGGDRKDAELPSIKALSKRVYYVGEVPKASVVKLAINNVFLTSLAALTESVALALGWGVSKEDILSYLRDTWLKVLVDRYEGRGFNREFPTRFPIRLAVKDLSYVSSALSKVKLPSALASSAADLYSQAVNEGFSNNDYSNILFFFKELVTSRKV